MRFNLFLVGCSLFALALCGCGTNGGAGLNGSISVSTPVVTGKVVSATATYINPTSTNLIGVPLTFSVRIGDQTFPLGTFGSNNSGSFTVTFDAPPFNGSQTITVIASSGNLINFGSVVMTGRSLTVAAPPAVALTTTQPAGTSIPFSILSPTAFVTITDPFSSTLEGHAVTITASFVSSNPSDTLTLDSSIVTTNSGGTAIFPGAHGTLVVPASGAETMSITWTVFDQTTGLSGSGTTSVSLTKTS
jgi:hypothetical protein